MTKTLIEEFRRMRRRKLRYGRRAFSPDEWERYNRIDAAVHAWHITLDKPEREIVYWYYIKAYGCEAVGFHAHYSERQVRRIRRRILAALDDA